MTTDVLTPARTAPQRTQDEPIGVVESRDLEAAQGRLEASLAGGRLTVAEAAALAASSLGQGTFGRLDEHSGSYSYRIPVFVPPPQHGGPTPRIALAYSSMGSAAPSLLGAGWRLELGRIERLGLYGGKVDFRNNQGEGKARDGFVLHLDGRTYTLVSVAGATDRFRAKIEDSFAEAERVLARETDPASGEPEIDHWVVRLGNGTRYTFGVPGKAGGTEAGGELRNKIWHLTAIVDVHGRQALYEYEAFRRELPEPVWKEMAYSYPVRVRSGVSADGRFWDSEVELAYTDADAPSPDEGYGNLGTAYTGRELPTGDGYVAILWRRLKEIRTLYRGAGGRLLPCRSLLVDAAYEPRHRHFEVRSVQEVGYTDAGEPDRAATLPPHRFTYASEGKANPAVVRTATTPLGKVEELAYGPASQLDEGSPKAVDGIVLVRSLTERAGEESWTRTFRYWDGRKYTPFQEYQGHRRVEATERETGLKTETTFLQNVVHNGQIERQVSYDARGRRRSLLSQRWLALDYSGGRYLPFVQHKVEIDYAEDGTTVLGKRVTEIPARPAGQAIPYALDRFGNPLEQVLSVYDRDEPGALPVLQVRTLTTYLNVVERERRLIGLPTEVRRFAREAGLNWTLVEWQEKRYDERGEPVEIVEHLDAEDPGHVRRQTLRYVPETGQVAARFRHDGGEALPVEAIRYHDKGPLRFLPRETVNALGHVRTHEQYDLRSRQPSRTVEPDGRLLLQAYDGLGRTVEEIHRGIGGAAGRDATPSSARYRYVVAAEERSIETHHIATGRLRKEHFDALERRVKVVATGHRGRWVVEEAIGFDPRTRKPARIAEPHFADEPAAGERRLDYDDPRLRPTRETFAGGKVLRTLYDGHRETRLEEVYERDEAGRPTRLAATRLVEEITRDALGRVIRRAEGQPASPLRYEVGYRYDLKDRPLAATDSLGVTLRRWDYGSRLDDQPVATEDVSLGRSASEYDGLARLARRRRDLTAELSRVSTFRYDALDRVLREEETDGAGGARREVERSYDRAPNGVGRPAAVTVRERSAHGEAVKRESYAYDAFGLPASTEHSWEVRWPELGVSRQLAATLAFRHNGEKEGRLEAVVFPAVEGVPGATVEYSYDDLSGLAESARLDGALLWEVPSYDARRQLRQLVFGNGVGTRLDYQPASGELSGITTAGKGGEIFACRLNRDSAGNVRARRTRAARPAAAATGPAGAGAAETTQSLYRYDDKHQLVRAEEDGRVEAFTYLANGSRETLLEGSAVTTCRYEGPSRHRVTALAGARDRRLTYDRAGNLLEDRDLAAGRVRRLAWSPASRLAGVTLEDGAGRLVRRLAYARDGQLERAVKVDSAGPRLTLYAGEHFEIEVDLTGGAVTTRAHALLGPRRVATRTRGRGEAARLAYLHRDHLQSVVAVTGAGGELAAAASLGVRGEVRGQAGEAGSDLLFTGHRAELSASDGFSLYDFRARLYDPDLGLFLSPDEAQDPHNAAFGWNRYLYVGNNPATAIDPTGRYSWWNPSTWDVWNNPVMDLVANKDTAAFAAGAGDAASMGLTDMAREATGLNQVVDKKSGAYAAGEVVGTVAGAALPTPPGMNAAMKMAGKAVELTGKAVVATGKTVAKGLKKVAEVGDVAFGALNHLREAKHLKTKLERARSAVEEGIWREPKAGGLINGTEVFPPGSDGALKKFSDHYVADDAVLHLETFGKQSGVTERVAEAAEKTLGLYD